MVRKTTLVIGIAMVSMFVGGVILTSSAYAQDHEEVIIEGEDRSPAGNVSEYGDTKQPNRVKESETTDFPQPSVDRTINQPRLERGIKTGSDTEARETGTVLGSETSYKWLWGVAIGVAVIAVSM